MSRVETFSVGDLRCHTIEAGRQWLDGGAMFGVVPKVLWQRTIDVDDKNRIPLAMRCLLVEHDDGLVLVDTGLGNKENEKFRSIYGVDNAGAGGLTHLEDGLHQLGFSPDDVRTVINTHLHFDHAGGNTRVGADGRVEPAFPAATYVLARPELEFAGNTNERTAGSYLPPNFEPITGAGRWRLQDEPGVVVPGVSTLATPGHVPHHRSVLVTSAGETACFLGDLVPTTRHLPLPWIMGYDLEPLVTLENKRELLGRAVDEGWTLVFEHDPDRGRGVPTRDGDRIVLSESLA